MSNIIVYTTNYCPYCVKAKKFLQQKGLNFTEIDLTGKDSEREELVVKSGGRKTVPQIFINEKHVGGCDDLHALSESELNDMLNLK